MNEELSPTEVNPTTEINTFSSSATDSPAVLIEPITDLQQLLARETPANLNEAVANMAREITDRMPQVAMHGQIQTQNVGM